MYSKKYEPIKKTNIRVLAYMFVHICFSINKLYLHLGMPL